jgi:hypothetical protein
MKQVLLLDNTSKKSNDKRNSPITIKTVMGYTLFHPDDLPRGSDRWNKLARPKEQKKKQKNVKTKTKTQIVESGSAMSHVEAISGPHMLVDLSQGRFAGLPRIMGDFRRAARTATSAPVRPCKSEPTTSSISFGNTWQIWIRATANTG